MHERTVAQQNKNPKLKRASSATLIACMGEDAHLQLQRLEEGSVPAMVAQEMEDLDSEEK